MELLGDPCPDRATNIMNILSSSSNGKELLNIAVVVIQYEMTIAINGFKCYGYDPHMVISQPSRKQPKKVSLNPTGIRMCRVFPNKTSPNRIARGLSSNLMNSYPWSAQLSNERSIGISTWHSLRASGSEIFNPLGLRTCPITARWSQLSPTGRIWLLPNISTPINTELPSSLRYGHLYLPLVCYYYCLLTTDLGLSRSTCPTTVYNGM
ncbi:hypothetical protein TIFTF001_006120 [Ficus carica]|uniref:Uncharacterized protein n=1 Tax=Ficus carica TaxID=3494 RepID=A0AA87ZNK6_FICCA|nr:hypothetical protein TIFTF001_006120 [Ficus carica]